MADSIINLKNIYGSRTHKRDRFLDAADRLSKLTLPTLFPKGDMGGDQEPFEPYTHRGTQAIRSLASQMIKIQMPNGVQWGRVDLPPQQWGVLRNTKPESEASVQKAMQEWSDHALTSLSQKRARSRAAAAIRRNLVEGNTLLVNSKEDIRIFPLRSFVCSRDAGELRWLILQETIEPDPFAGEAKKNMERYTLVRYPVSDRQTGKITEDGGVWQQIDDGHMSEADYDYRQYIVIVPEIPEFDDYAYGYAYHYLRLISQLDHIERSLGEAIFIAAYNRPGIREGSTAALNYSKFVKGKSGEPWIGHEDDFFWITSDTKIGEWSFIASIESILKDELASTFAMGIKDRPVGSDTSATEILQIVDELNTQTADLLTAMEETFQKPLFESEVVLLERDGGSLIPEGLSNIGRVVVTTGTSELARQQSLMRFSTQFLPAMQALDPMRLKINSGAIIQAFEDSMPFDTTAFYEWTPEPPPEMQAAMDAQVAADEMERTETVMTAGGPQPPQPPQGATGR